MRFDTLRESLLQGGVAPRHVRRYLAELEDHLADLTAREKGAGYDAEDAAIRARAALGDNAVLAQAMLARPGLRSLTARAPWLVFGIVPPLALILSYVLWVLIVVLIGVAGGAIHLHQKIHMPVPGWFDWTASGLMFAANFVIGPAVAWMLAWMARRQRMSLVWPLVGVAIMLALGLQGSMAVGKKSLQIGLTSIFPLAPRATLNGPASIHWPIFLAQALVLSLPLIWPLHIRRKAGAQV